MKTELKSRTLWFDGTNQVSPDLVPNLLLAGVDPTMISVTALNEDIELFNSLSDTIISIEKLSNIELVSDFIIPKLYVDINLVSYLENLLHTDDVVYHARLENEMLEIKLRGMDLLVKTLIYIVDEFKRQNIVWGVGRGSSCASLVLFLIGLHCVDPIKYNIPLTEFFH